MKKLILKGKNYLSGQILISGSKNATLPILAASILSRTTLLKNIPLVKDVFTMVELLNSIGSKVVINKKNNSLKIFNTKDSLSTVAPYK